MLYYAHIDCISLEFLEKFTELTSNIGFDSLSPYQKWLQYFERGNYDISLSKELDVLN